MNKMRCAFETCKVSDVSFGSYTRGGLRVGLGVTAICRLAKARAKARARFKSNVTSVWRTFQWPTVVPSYVFVSMAYIGTSAPSPYRASRLVVRLMPRPASFLFVANLKRAPFTASSWSGYSRAGPADIPSALHNAYASFVG